MSIVCVCALWDLFLLSSSTLRKRLCGFPNMKRESAVAVRESAGIFHPEFFPQQFKKGFDLHRRCTFLGGVGGRRRL